MRRRWLAGDTRMHTFNILDTKKHMCDLNEHDLGDTGQNKLVCAASLFVAGEGSSRRFSPAGLSLCHHRSRIERLS